LEQLIKIFLAFLEREENVKADIFHAFIAVLKQTNPSGSVRDWLRR
jgi:cullin-associated NEDD8-dissociated protein 1